MAGDKRESYTQHRVYWVQGEKNAAVWRKFHGSSADCWTVSFKQGFIRHSTEKVIDLFVHRMEIYSTLLHSLVPAWLIKANSTNNIDWPKVIEFHTPLTLTSWTPPPPLVVKTCLDPRADTCSDPTNIETDMIDWAANNLWDIYGLEMVPALV